jgi:predicted dehydrogenase
MTAGSINTALIGLGRIGWMLEHDPYRYHPCTHAGSLLHEVNLRRYRLVAGCDINAERRRRFYRYARKYGQNVALFEDIEALVGAIRRKELTVDLAVLATGPESHPQLFRRLLAAGVRNFLIEKPVALNARQAGQMLRLAEKQKATVRVNFERRYHPAYALVRRLIESQRFGELRHIEGRVLAPSLRRDALLEDAVHWIDLLLWYAGEPVNVRSMFRRDEKGREKGSLHIFQYTDFDAVLESGGMRRYFEFVMRLDFERGRIVAGNDGHFHFESRASRRYRGFYDLQPVPIKLSRKEHNPWLELYREIAVQDGIRSSLEQAVTGLKWIDRCRRFT